MTIDTIETCPSDSKLGVVTTASTRSSPRLPVKRSLFGEVDHEECMNFLNKELNAINEKATKRWNFDFQADKPLQPGQYEWTPVQCNEIIPKVYDLSWSHSIEKNNTETITDNRQNSCLLVTVSKPTPTKLAPKLMQTSIDGKFIVQIRLSRYSSLLW